MLDQEEVAVIVRLYWCGSFLILYLGTYYIFLSWFWLYVISKLVQVIYGPCNILKRVLFSVVETLLLYPPLPTECTDIYWHRLKNYDVEYGWVFLNLRVNLVNLLKALGMLKKSLYRILLLIFYMSVNLKFFWILCL